MKQKQVNKDRPILCRFYDRNYQCTKVNACKNIDNAIIRCFLHMHLKSYEGTWTSEVYDSNNGRLYAAFKVGKDSVHVNYLDQFASPKVQQIRKAK